MADETPTATAPVLEHNGQQTIWGTGRRKTSVARVRILTNGSGRMLVNKKDFVSFLPVERLRQIAKSPLDCTEKAGEYDIFVNVRGGGITGQAGAIRQGIARALLKIEPDIEPNLRDNSHLTRDSRMKERNKPGRRGARRGFQFSKR